MRNFQGMDYFYMSTNIQGDFQICISVPLTEILEICTFSFKLEQLFFPKTLKS